MFGFRKRSKDKEIKINEDSLLASLDKNKLPRHIAIIMDGNGRWANKRGMPRAYGHKMGVKAFKEVVKICSELNLEVLTVYAFSTENWKRPSEEVNSLMNLLVDSIDKELEEIYENNVIINPIGKLDGLVPSVQKSLQIAVEKTKNNTGLLLNLALNYGSRMEIVLAMQSLGKKIANGELSYEQIDESMIASQLYTSKIPDPDLLIRTSGDFRISNFLLWQIAYAEFWYTKVLWPDFGRLDLFQALLDYQKRDRRFGGLKK